MTGPTVHLRRTLTLWYVGVFALILAGFGAAVYEIIAWQVSAGLDRSLTTTVEAAGSLIAEGRGDAGALIGALSPGRRVRVLWEGESGASALPAPRVHRHRYHGVLAPNSRLRSAVVNIGSPEGEPLGAKPLVPPGPTSSQPRSLEAEPARLSNPAPIRWAVLLAPHLCGAPVALLRMWGTDEDRLVSHGSACGHCDPHAP